VQPLKARVQNGRIHLDEPTDLPDGDVYLVAADPMTDSERAELEAALAEGLADAREGRVADANEVIQRIEARRVGSVHPSR